MNIKSNIVLDIITDTFFIFSSVTLLIFNYFSLGELGICVILLAILSNIQLLFKSENALLIINLFLLTYWLALVPFFIYGINYHIYDMYQTVELTTQVVLMQVIFQRLITTPKTCKRIDISNIHIRKSKSIFYLAIIIAFIFNLFTIFVSKTVLSVGYENSFNEGTVFLEYVVIPLLIACFHCNKSKKVEVYVMLSIILCSMLLPLFYGKRLPFILCGMVFYLFFLENKLSKYKLICLVLLTLLSVQVLGVIRDSEYSFSINYLLFGLKENGEYSNNQGGVTAASVAYLGLVKDGVFDLSFRLISFGSQFVTAFVPSSMAPDETFINVEAMKHTPIPGNGGFTSTYSYLFLGPVGVILFSGFFRFILSIRTNSVLIMIFPILTLVLFPRWMVYSIFPYIKILIWALIFYISLNFFKSFLGQVRK